MLSSPQQQPPAFSPCSPSLPARGSDTQQLQDQARAAVASGHRAMHELLCILTELYHSPIRAHSIASKQGTIRTLRIEFPD